MKTATTNTNENQIYLPCHFDVIFNILLFRKLVVPIILLSLLCTVISGNYLEFVTQYVNTNIKEEYSCQFRFPYFSTKIIKS